MGKIDTLNTYIEECNTAISNRNYPPTLVNKIVDTYYIEIGLRDNMLSSEFRSAPTETDIHCLVALLTDYKDEIEIRENREIIELEKLKSKKVVMENPIHITNNNNSNATANVCMSMSLVNTLERIQALPNSVLDDKEKEELEDKLTVLQAALDKGDSDKAKSKLTNVLKYIGDKCVDVGIALLPYLGTAANSLGQ